VLNKVQLIGNLGRDVELRSTPNGKAIANFSMAVEGGKDKTEWANIEAWETTAENCAKYIAKGSKVYVEGKFKTESWEKEGQKHYRTVVVANRVLFLDKKENSDRPQSRQQDDGFDEMPFEEGDLPF